MHVRRHGRSFRGHITTRARAQLGDFCQSVGGGKAHRMRKLVSRWGNLAARPMSRPLGPAVTNHSRSRHPQPADELPKMGALAYTLRFGCVLAFRHFKFARQDAAAQSPPSGHLSAAWGNYGNNKKKPMG